MHKKLQNCHLREVVLSLLGSGWEGRLGSSCSMSLPTSPEVCENAIPVGGSDGGEPTFLISSPARPNQLDVDVSDLKL